MKIEILIKPGPGECCNLHDCGFRDYWPTMDRIFGKRYTDNFSLALIFDIDPASYEPNNVREQLLAEVLGLVDPC